MRSFVHPPKVIFILVAILASAAISRAAITVTIEEIGSNVKASYTGSLDTTDMGFAGLDAYTAPRIWPSEAAFWALTDDESYLSLLTNGGNTWESPPSPFGTGGQVFASSSSINSGNSFFFSPAQIMIPASYTSGNPLSGSLIFENKTLQTLGITLGTYNATFGSGDTLTINAIPEPSSYGFLLGAVGLATAIFCRRRRRPSAV